MMVLAIDTCGPSGSIALGRVESDALSILAQNELQGKTYSAQLVPAVRALLAERHGSADVPGTILIVNGPGSFTGVRIGVSAAKGFAEAWGIPLLAVSRLAVLAWKARKESAALDAGRGEFYVREGGREFLCAATSLPDSAAFAVCEPGALCAFPQAVLVDPPSVADALSFAAPRLLARDFADVSALDGHYLRRSDAEIFAKAAGKA